MLVGMSDQRVNLTFPKVVMDTGRSKAPPNSQRGKKKRKKKYSLLLQFSVNVFPLERKSMFNILKLTVQTIHFVSNHKHNLSGVSVL